MYLDHFFNTHKINKGEQLGISYGNGYWIERGVKPELFDLEGNSISETEYGYKEILISWGFIPRRLRRKLYE